MRTFAEIKAAVDAGHTVHWLDPAYVVVSSATEYLVVCTTNNHAVSLYDPDYSPSEFYVAIKEAA